MRHALVCLKAGDRLHQTGKLVIKRSDEVSRPFTHVGTVNVALSYHVYTVALSRRIFCIGSVRDVDTAKITHADRTSAAFCANDHRWQARPEYQ